MNYGYIKTTAALTVHFEDGGSYTWNSDDPNYTEAIDVVRRQGDETDLRALIVDLTKTKIATAKYGDFTVDEDGVSFRGKVLNLSLTNRIIDMVRDEFDVTPMFRFLESLLKNQRREAVMSLYDFMEHNKLPIRSDGRFLAYKIVRPDYKDIYSGTFDNSVGASPEMLPWEVEADRERTCSQGLHVCSKEYLPHYGSGGSKIMIVAVWPEHVVAVPRDYNNAKMRVWKYEVIGEMASRESTAILEAYSTFDQAAGEATATSFTWGANAWATDDEDEDTADGEAQQLRTAILTAWPNADEDLLEYAVMFPDEFGIDTSTGRPFIIADRHGFGEDLNYSLRSNGVHVDISSGTAADIVESAEISLAFYGSDMIQINVPIRA